MGFKVPNHQTITEQWIGPLRALDVTTSEELQGAPSNKAVCQVRASRCQLNEGEELQGAGQTRAESFKVPAK